jgi:hypothetical protein
LAKQGAECATEKGEAQERAFGDAALVSFGEAFISTECKERDDVDGKQSAQHDQRHRLSP